MSLVSDFMNQNIQLMSRFPGSPSYGDYAGRGPELHLDAVLSMSELDEEGVAEFVVLRFMLSESSDGHLQAELRMLFDYNRGEDGGTDEFALPFFADSSLAVTVARYMALHDVDEPLTGEGLRLAHAIDILKDRFSDTIMFQYEPHLIPESFTSRVLQ